MTDTKKTQTEPSPPEEAVKAMSNKVHNTILDKKLTYKQQALRITSLEQSKAMAFQLAEGSRVAMVREVDEIKETLGAAEELISHRDITINKMKSSYEEVSTLIKHVVSQRDMYSEKIRRLQRKNNTMSDMLILTSLLWCVIAVLSIFNVATY